MSTSTTATPVTGSEARTGTNTTWTIDAAHTHVAFAIKHLMIATVRGRFTEVQGTVTVDEADPLSARIDITIPTASISTGDEKRDGHLRSPDFFDVERYPTITYRSTRVEPKSNDAFRVIGDLTIRDVTREVTLDAHMLGRAKDPWGQEHTAVEATAKIKRGDYGLTWNAPLETGGLLVGDEVNISIEAQLLRQR
jgi:polyisoprenoid-binding protein YceI